jgi:hypothetical protein
MVSPLAALKKETPAIDTANGTIAGAGDTSNAFELCQNHNAQQW